jgi:hypothetical protein
MRKPILIEPQIVKSEHELVIETAKKPLIAMIKADQPTHGGKIEHPPSITVT